MEQTDEVQEEDLDHYLNLDDDFYKYYTIDIWLFYCLNLMIIRSFLKPSNSTLRSLWTL